MIGTTIGHYTILEKLGEGGMGVVYKALDTRLDRTVALKFLPDRHSADASGESRFLQEAKAASALNHPNVCGIHSIAIHEGRSFIDMEYVEGETLRQRIARGSLKIEEALVYAVQIGEALQEAHARGIVHRDIKSDNIMVNVRNQIKVMDFGLAKLKGSLRLTRSSSTVGTLAYMSPEQIKGVEADARSDIFSFGVVFYELVTGRTPFRGDHEAAVMYSILNENPDSVALAVPAVSREVVHILGKALEKDPDMRYQSAADMVADLRRAKRDSSRVATTGVYSPPPPPGYTPGPGTPNPPGDIGPGLRAEVPASGSRRTILLAGGGGLALIALVLVALLGPWRGGGSAGSSERKMLVVLPFENLGSAEQEYFADGITEEITGKLSGLSGLGVIATTSARQYKKTTKTLREVGAELGVGYVLQGTIRWSADEERRSRVRVSPALIRVDDGTQIWSQSFNAVVSDVFSIQSDIASQVAGAMGVSLLNPERESLGKRPTENSEAYDLYLRGGEYFRRSYSRGDFEIAVGMYEKAVAKDPAFALAWSRLAEAHAAMYWFFFDHTEERVGKAKAAADRALELDPMLPEAHMAIGYYYYWCRLEYEEALREFSLALKGRPNDGHLLLAVGAVQRRQGKVTDAIGSMTRAIEVDPRRSEYLFNISQSYQLARDYARAEDYIARALSLSPDLIDYYGTLVQVLLQRDGNTKRARAALRKAMQLSGYPETEELIWISAQVEVWDGKFDEGVRIVETQLKKPVTSQFYYVSPALASAQIHRWMGDAARARRLFESALSELERELRADPADARYHSALGIALAGLDRKREAIAAALKGVDLMPVEREAWRGGARLVELAQVYAMTGERDSAVALLGRLFAMPCDLSKAELEHEPRWRGLRDHPAFAKLIGTSQ